jgi:hypothetical protein
VYISNSVIIICSYDWWRSNKSIHPIQNVLIISHITHICDNIKKSVSRVKGCWVSPAHSFLVWVPSGPMSIFSFISRQLRVLKWGLLFDERRRLATTVIRSRLSLYNNVGSLNCFWSSPAQPFLASSLVEIYDQDFCSLLDVYAFSLQSGVSSSTRGGVVFSVYSDW